MIFKTRPVFCLLLTLLFSTLVPFQSASAKGEVVFVTPSKNILCEYFPKTNRYSAYVMCGFSKIDYFSLRDLQRESCPADTFGRDVEAYNFALEGNGKGYIACANDVWWNTNLKKNVLSYGKSISLGKDFVCTSRSSGLTCTNNVGNGFFMSRQKQKVW